MIIFNQIPQATSLGDFENPLSKISSKNSFLEKIRYESVNLGDAFIRWTLRRLGPESNTKFEQLLKIRGEGNMERRLFGLS